MMDSNLPRKMKKEVTKEPEKQVENQSNNVVDENIVYGCTDDPNIFELEDIVYSDDDEDVGVEADMNNLDAFMSVIPIPAIRIHKDHPVEQIIRDLNSAPQTRRMTKNLKEHALDTSKHASTRPRKPISPQKPLLKDEDGEEVDVHLYRSMIGSLMYLTSSRPDIMFVVCACARYQVNPKVSHLHAVKRIFRYLKGQPKLGLWYLKDSPFDLVAYTDSDYAGASLDRKSTTGGCQFLGCRLISWQCKKQTVVANSITEAEYVAASSCCGQVLWIQNQLLDYGYNFMHTKIYIDNESTICIVKNLVFHSKTKHIEIRHHFIRDSNEKKLIQMIKIHTDKNVADLLTKAFDQLALMGVKSTAWNEFSSTMASAIIYLATNQKFNFSKYIFKSMVKIVDSSVKFLMYPRVRKGFSRAVTVKIFDREVKSLKPSRISIVQVCWNSKRATKPPSIIDWKIVKEGKICYYQIIRADGSLKRYSPFIQMLRSFDREDLETLSKLVKAKHGYTRPEEGYERVLWGDLKTMFEHHIEDAVWRNLQEKKCWFGSYLIPMEYTL
ncbi:hypothetical protein Tco_0715754 [Tanacetum coccineum]